MNWLIKEYMTKKHISSMAELARQTGIEYRTLINHINDCGKFRVFELRSLAEVLGLNDEDMLRLLREMR